MPTTYYQTAEIFDKNTGKKTYVRSYAPVQPDGSSKVYHDDESSTYWTTTSTYNITSGNKWTIWYNKPTIADAIKPAHNKSYFEFLSGGQVIHRFIDEDGKNVELWWSAPVERPKEDHISNNIPDFIECRVCGADAEGSDWQDYELCSRACMKETLGYDSYPWD
jgi:hypothetical protein